MNLRIILLGAIWAALACNVHAAVWTVSNNPNSPGQFTNLQTAIDAAGFYDTVMVAGSATSYGSISFGKPLVLIGAGYHNPFGNNTTVDNITLLRQNISVSANGSKIMGFIISSYVTLNGTFTGGVDSTRTINNIAMERCQFNIFRFGSNAINTFKNDTIRNCLITGYIQLYSYNHKFQNIHLHNNLFSSASASGSIYLAGASSSIISDLTSCYLRNNLFLNHITNCFSFIKNLVIENNIFYGAEPFGGTTCVLNKNLTYMCINNSIPGTGNSGAGNLVNIDPQFINFPVAGGAYSYSYNVKLKPSSAGRNAGSDGTDIGIYGGLKPYEVGANPCFPQMMEISFPSGSSAPVGGTLDVFFKAKKQN